MTEKELKEVKERRVTKQKHLMETEKKAQDPVMDALVQQGARSKGGFQRGGGHGHNLVSWNDADDEREDDDLELNLDYDSDLEKVLPDQTIHLRDYRDLWGQNVSVGFGCQDIDKENQVRKNNLVHFDMRDPNNVPRGKHYSNQGYTEWEAVEGLEYLTADSGAEIDTKVQYSGGLVEWELRPWGIGRLQSES